MKLMNRNYLQCDTLGGQIHCGPMEMMTFVITHIKNRGWSYHSESSRKRHEYGGRNTNTPYMVFDALPLMQ